MFTDSFKKKLIALFVSIILIIILIYFWNFLNREKVVFYNWKENQIITTNKNKFNLKGKISFIKNIYLDNKEYFVDENENFDIPISLYDGYNEFYFLAKTFSNKEIRKKIIIFKK